jgi:hypothetical protein
MVKIEKALLNMQTNIVASCAIGCDTADESPNVARDGSSDARETSHRVWREMGHQPAVVRFQSATVVCPVVDPIAQASIGSSPSSLVVRCQGEGERFSDPKSKSPKVQKSKSPKVQKWQL